MLRFDGGACQAMMDKALGDSMISGSESAAVKMLGLMLTAIPLE